MKVAGSQFLYHILFSLYNTNMYCHYATVCCCSASSLVLTQSRRDAYFLFPPRLGKRALHQNLLVFFLAQHGIIGKPCNFTCSTFLPNISAFSTEASQDKPNTHLHKTLLCIHSYAGRKNCWACKFTLTSPEVVPFVYTQLSRTIR